MRPSRCSTDCKASAAPRPTGPALRVEEVGRQERASADDPAALDGAATGGKGEDPAMTSRRRATGMDIPSAPLCLPHTDWLHHRLVVTGPAEQVAALRTATAGAGTVS